MESEGAAEGGGGGGDAGYEYEDEEREVAAEEAADEAELPSGRSSSSSAAAAFAASGSAASSSAAYSSSSASPMLSPPRAGESREAAQARVGLLREQRAGLVAQLLDALEKGRGPYEDRLHFPSPAAVKLHDDLTKLETSMLRLIRQHRFEDEDTDLDLAGLPGFMSVGDVVYTSHGLACEVLRADLGPSQAHAGRVTVWYTVGKPELTTLPFGAEYLTSRKVKMPSTSLTFEPPPRLG
jgi:hypothetical protein